MGQDAKVAKIGYSLPDAMLPDFWTFLDSSDRECSTDPVEPKRYSVSRTRKQPLLDYVRSALMHAGCRILHEPDPAQAPYRFTFETPNGERLGIVVYAFYANSRLTRNRPANEHRFQVKYSKKEPGLQPIWQDPYMLYTTLFCGIDPERGTFVGADPVLHNPTRFFISIEYKQEDADAIQEKGWHFWERDQRSADDPVEVLVGGTKDAFLRYVRFEREALGEAQGTRHLLAERLFSPLPGPSEAAGSPSLIPPAPTLHALAGEFQMKEAAVLDLIARARRLKMAVRGWVAEHHLELMLQSVPGVTQCRRNDEEGRPDIDLIFNGVPLRVECKNVLREREKSTGHARLDFQRTRASKSDPCSRYYAAGDFDVLAACLNAVDRRWTYSFIVTANLEPNKKCPGKLSNNVRIDRRWSTDVVAVLTEAVRRKS